eukprot:1142496-Pelagomonas_calceolata.AAC.4
MPVTGHKPMHVSARAHTWTHTRTYEHTHTKHAHTCPCAACPLCRGNISTGLDLRTDVSAVLPQISAYGQAEQELHQLAQACHPAIYTQSKGSCKGGGIEQIRRMCPTWQL